MTTPTLSLGVHASGADQILKVASAVDQLRNSLAQLASQSSSNAVAGLQKMAQDFRQTRQQITTAMQGMKTDLGSGFQDIERQITTSTKKIEAAAKAGAAAINHAMNSITGPTGSVASAANSGQLGQMAQQITAIGARAQATTPHMEGMGKAMNDAHSAARGLASGFNAMWLTWGNLVPLLAGAGLSHAFSTTIKVGAEVQHTFKQIQTLSEETGESVFMLESKMVELGKNGPFGPQEIAKAMKTLSLAGLEAKEVYSGISDVLNFAVAGDMKVEAAADAITTVATAFNISAKNYSYVADVIAKAAAVSKSSVEGMASSFKTASVIHQQYGVSLEDTAVALALLANAGVQGTAAGTALRNMIVDLSGRTPKVTKVLKDMGIDGIDPVTGKMKDQLTILNQLIPALAKYTPQQQMKALQGIFSERGGKAAIAEINAMQQAAKDAGMSVDNYFEEIQQKIMDSAGYAAKAAAILSLTPLNQLRSIASTLETVMTEVFHSVENKVVNFAYAMKQSINSDEFKRGLADLVGALGDLALTLINNIKWLIAFGAAASALAGVGAIARSIAAGVQIWAAATAEGIGLVAMASRAAMLANPVLTALIGLVQVGAAAWMAYEGWIKKASTATEDGTSSHLSLLSRLEQENDRLVKVNEARRTGISLMELEAKQKLTQMRSQDTEALATAKDKLRSVEAQIGSIPKTALVGRDLNGSPIYDPQALSQRDKLNKLLQEQAFWQARVNTEEDVQRRVIEKTEEQLMVLRANSQEAHKAGAAEAANKVPVSGSKVLPDTTAGKRMKELSDRQLLSLDNDRQVIEQMARKNEATLREVFNRKRTILDAQHQAELISEGQFQARMLDLTSGYEQEQVQNLREALVLAQREHDELVAKVQASKQMSAQEKAARTHQLDNNLEKYRNNVRDDLTTISENASQRQQLAIIGYEKQIKSLRDTQADYWSKTEAGIAKENNLASVRLALANATDEVRAKYEAEQKVLADGQPNLDNLIRQYAKAAKGIEDYLYVVGNLDTASEEQVQTYNRQYNVLLALAKAIETAQSKLSTLSQSAGVAAFNESLAKQFIDGSKKITETLADAILEGGKNGGAKLKDWLKDYFIKQPLKIALQAVLSPVGGFFQNLFMGLKGNMTGEVMPQFGNNPSAYMAGASGVGSAISGLSGIGNLTNMLGLGANLGMGEFGAGLATGFNSLMGGNVMGGLGAAADIGGMGGLGMGLGVVGPLVLGGLALSSLFSSGGGPKQGGNYNPFTADKIDIGSQDTPKLQQQAVSAALALQQSYDQMVHALGGFGGYKFGVGISTDPEGKAPSFVQVAAGRGTTREMESVNTGVGRSSEELQAALSKQTTDILIQALQHSNLDQPFVEYLNQVAAKTDEAARQEGLKTLQDVAAYTKGIEGMGGVFAQIASLSIDARGALIQAAGGLQALEQATQSYYNNFYTEDERRAIGIQRMNSTLAKAGLSLSGFDLSADNVAKHAQDLRNQFRALVEAQSVNTEEGQKSFAALISVSDAFAQLTQTAQTAATATKDVAAERASLEQQLMQAQGDTIGLRKLERDALDESNRALYDQIQAVNDQKTVTEQRKGLEQQLLQAQGDTAGLHRLERDALDESNRALYDEIQALNAQKTVLDQRKGLEQQLYQAQNNVVQLRRLENEALDESNRALHDRIMALSDAKAVLQKAEEQHLADQNKQIDAMKEATTKFRDFAKSLRDFRTNLMQGELSPLTPAQKYSQAYQTLVDTYNKAHELGPEGDTARSQLQGAAEAFLQASRVYNASNDQYTADFEMVKKYAEIGANEAASYADYAEQQVNLLTDQRDYQKNMLDALLGIDTRVASIGEALMGMGSLATPEQSGYISNYFQNMLGHPTDVVTQQYWQGRAAMGATPTDLAYFVTGSSEFKQRVGAMLASGDIYGAYNLGKGSGLSMSQLDQAAGFSAGTIEQWAQANGLPIFHSGTPYVPRTGLAVVQRGERILSRGNNDALVLEFRRMQELMKVMIASNYEANERAAKLIVDGTQKANKRSDYERRNAAEARTLA